MELSGRKSGACHGVWMAAIFLVSAGIPADSLAASSEALVADDVGRLYPTEVLKVVEGDDTADLVAIVREAAAAGLPVSIAGARHSQGGHTFYADGVVLDMRAYRRILDLDVANKRIVVQSGATWDDVQQYVNRRGLAVKVMQSSNIFTIGGSLSVNAHGRDPNYGPVIETVRSFRLLRADGSIVNVSRTDNAELFSLAIGGYGLFGVILDVELELTDNVPYEKLTLRFDYQDYPGWFADNVLGNARAGLHYGRMSIVRNAGFLREMYASTYYLTTAAVAADEDLVRETGLATGTAKLFWSLSRRFGWGKKLRWFLEEQLIERTGRGDVATRNDAMRPPVRFLDYKSGDATDILQEYFIPVENFVQFTDALRAIVLDHDVNLMNVTIRYVQADDEAFLAYARRNSFAFVLAFNHGLDAEAIAEAKIWTQALVAAALEQGGSYYLTYQLYPTQTQIRAAYPRLDDFFARKKIADPDERFINTFYANYAR